MGAMAESEKLVVAEHLAAAYSVNAPARCREWLDTLGTGAVRDRAVERAVSTLIRSDVPTAFELSESLSNESSRNARMREVLEVWIAVDAQAAEDALGGTPVLDDSEKGALLSDVRGNFKPNDYVIPGRASY